MMSPSGVAFFDVDHTLVAGSTMMLAAPAFRARGLIRRRHILRAALSHWAFEWGLAAPEGLFHAAARVFAGLPVDELRHLLSGVVHQRVVPCLYREGIARMIEHAAHGHRIVLLSGTSVYLLHELVPALARMDIPGAETLRDRVDIVATHQRAEAGRLVAEFHWPIPIGMGKVHAAQAYLARFGLSLISTDAQRNASSHNVRMPQVDPPVSVEAALASQADVPGALRSPSVETWFYTDSNTDLPLLSAVTHPRPVNPDGWLRWVAWRRGWPVTRFRQRYGTPVLPPTPPPFRPPMKL